jgi:hypothetical protein
MNALLVGALIAVGVVVTVLVVIDQLLINRK